MDDSVASTSKALKIAWHPPNLLTVPAVQVTAHQNGHNSKN